VINQRQEQPVSEPVTTTSAVDELAERFFEWFLERQPLYGTVLGYEHLDDRLPDDSAEGREQEIAGLKSFLAETATIPRDALGQEDSITIDMVEVVARIRLRQHEHFVHQFESMDQMAGPQGLPGELSMIQRVDTPERVDRLVRRLEAYPGFLAAHRENLLEGVRDGRTAARPVVARVIEQTRRLVATPVEETPLLGAHPDLDDEARARIRQAIETHVQPAIADYLRTLEEYQPHAREGDGVWALPDGDALYRTMILSSTTLEEEPEALHGYGLEQLEAIDAERLQIARELGFSEAKTMRTALEGDPANTAREREEIVERARQQIDRAMEAAPRYFGRLPRATCEVRAVEAFQEVEAPPAFYMPPPPDGSRPGRYYVNTYQPESRPLHRLAAATFHEAVPGHHFQIAIETELEDLNVFRRLGSRLVGTAYPEGWGLYSERLADEMGLYDGPWERLGMLDAQAWRAARLVVDTGIHAFRWTRARSVEFLRKVGLSQHESETETDRYITWPGQALTYMTGQREIEGLRRRLEERDGDRFHLPTFHDAVLAHGSLPLATLRRELPGWVAPRAD
jgi:uncharacterized protein (DUF885 family)